MSSPTYSLNSVIKAVVSTVDESMLHPTQKKRRRRHPLQGYCYVVAEALWHMELSRGYLPMRVTCERQSHWFLQHAGDGHIIDPTAGQFRHNVPYNKAKRAGFLTREPSARARVLMEKAAFWLMQYGCEVHKPYRIENLVRTKDDWKPTVPGGFCRVKLVLNHTFLRSSSHRVEVSGHHSEIGRYAEYFGPAGAGKAVEMFEHLSDKGLLSLTYLKELGFLIK